MKEVFDEYIVHIGQEADEFIADYFKPASILLIGGVGFDPRTTVVAQRLSGIGAKITAKFIKEIRSSPPPALEKMANDNIARVAELLGLEPEVFRVDIFADDRAAVGGRKVVEVARAWDLSSVTDIIVDISAVSVGIFFPLVRLLREAIESDYPETSLHIFVCSNPSLDHTIRPNYDDQASYMHGYGGNAKLVGRADPIKLWLPQLVSGRKEIYERLHKFTGPSDVCPVVPFLGKNPRRAEELIFEYRDSLVDEWEADLNNVVLADECDPLDIYRTICRIDDRRRRIFSPHSDTMTIISPTGSKLSAVGGMLAAMDSGLPVAYVEAAGYSEGFMEKMGPHEQSTLVHIWVHGPAYQ